MFNPDYEYTLEEYWKLVETFPNHKYEYVDGHVRMMTGGSPAHAQIGMNIGRVLANILLEQECNVYSSDAVVQLANSKCYCPDISVSCDPADWTRKKALESPTVVVEVISPSTEGTDRGEKLDAYRQYPTIQEILLVDSRKCHVEHYQRIGVSEWKYVLYVDRDDIVDFSSVDVRFSVRDIYLKVYLELEEQN